MRRIILIVIVIVALPSGLAYWYLTRHSFSARERPTAVETILARNVRWLSTPAGARDVQNPIAATPDNISKGRDEFADHCAICHGNNGSGQTLINSGLYPPAPDLREAATQNLSDGEIFYIIKNGVRFTGMPGWDHSDEENWILVGFIRYLPRLTPHDIEAMEKVKSIAERSPSEHHH